MKPSSSPVWVVVRFAVFTRVATLLLQLPLNLLIPDHDPGAFAPPPSAHESPFSRAVEWSLGGLARWDAAYFLFVAEHGYAYEQSVAFFPLFPVLVRTLAFVGIGDENDGGSGGSGHPDVRGRLILSAVCLNAVAFAAAAAALYGLGAAALRDEALALRAALLFCVTPASVFMSAAYSESLFACLSFAAALALELRRRGTSVALFALAAAARANGVVSAGFPVHRALSLCADSCRRRGRTYASDVLSVALAAASAAAVAAPFVAFQAYGRDVFCRSGDGGGVALPERLLAYARSRGYVVRGAARPAESPAEYCHAGWPTLYGHVQRTHWDVGFLRYYTARQLPNFALAAPMAVLAAAAVWSYARRNWRLCLRLGLVQDGAGREEGMGLRSGYYSSTTFVYVAHLAAMLLFGLTCMHVQVLTRFLASSCPAVYWFAAHLTLGRHLEPGGASRRPDASRDGTASETPAPSLSTSSTTSSSSTAQPSSSPSSFPSRAPPHLARPATSVARRHLGRDPPATAECRQRVGSREADALHAAAADGRTEPGDVYPPGPAVGAADGHRSWAARLGDAAARAALGALPRNDLTGDLARWGHLSAGARLVYGYFLSYALLGVALHCNQFPWT
ncbi:GPI alpha-1,6-mannosyltransferase 2 [Lampetra planeri]